MLRPRLRNNRAITLSRGNRLSRKHVVQSCWTTRNLLSLFHPLYQVYVVLAKLTGPKLKNSSDVPLNLVQGEELSEAGKLVEIALDVTYNLNASFPTCENCYRKTRKNLAQIRNQTKAKYFRIKRMSSKAPRRLVQIVQERSQRKYGHTQLTSILLSQVWKNSCGRNEVCGEVKDGSSFQVSHCH